MVDEGRRIGFNKAVRACIAWLHARANEMNDPHAKAVLNSAAFSLGVDKLGPLADALEARAPESGGANPTDEMVKAGCLAMQQCQGTDAWDTPTHAPWQKSWEEPSMQRWQQWDETVREVWMAMATLAQAAGCGGGEWRPISEAPRDGTRILAFNEAAGIYSTAFTTRWTGEPYEKGYEGFPCGFWSTGLGSYPFGRWDVQPTFWMPLPAPPTGEPG